MKLSQLELGTDRVYVMSKKRLKNFVSLVVIEKQQCLQNENWLAFGKISECKRKINGFNHFGLV